MKAIILAAGGGKRLEKITKESLPKCLLEIGDKSLLERQKDILYSFGIRNITVVVGYDKRVWRDETIDKVRSLVDDVVVNYKSLDTHSPYSLYLGLMELKTPKSILVLDGDLIFEKKVIRAILDEPRESVIVTRAIESLNLDEAGSKIIVDTKGRVVVSRFGIFSHRLYAGIFKTSKRNFKILKKVFSNEKYWTQQLAAPLNELCQDTDYYNLHLNTEISLVRDIKHYKDVSQKPTVQTIEKVDNIMRKYSLEADKLKHEVNWLLGLDNSLKIYFPHIKDYRFGGSENYYSMEYCSYPVLRDLILGRQISLNETLKILKKILDFMFKEVYTKKILLTPPNYLRECYFEKFRIRSRTVAGRSRIFDSLIKLKQFKMNGCKLVNGPIIISELDKNIEFLGELEPPDLSLVHGDFKVDNMLVDIEKDEFVLIDPRGISPIGRISDDYMTDIAKLFTSFDCYYDLLNMYRFNLNISKRGDEIELSFDDIDMIADLEKIGLKLKKILSGYNKIKADTNWTNRLIFTEAMLMISNAPFRLVSKKMEDIERSIGIYLQGVRHLNKLVEDSPLTKSERYDFLNINTPMHYGLAKEIFKNKNDKFKMNKSENPIESYFHNGLH